MCNLEKENENKNKILYQKVCKVLRVHDLSNSVHHNTELFIIEDKSYSYKNIAYVVLYKLFDRLNSR